MALEGKVALVTGGSRGIGRAICEALGREGAAVVVNYVSSADAADEAATSIKSGGGRAVALQGDVADAAQAERLVADTLEQFETIDILVNNAGIILRTPMVETSDEDWDRVFSVNVAGCFHCTRAVARHMIERGQGGHIINISSVNAAIGIVNRSCYAATKGAMEAFTRVCAVELGDYGIQVNAVAPGLTLTDMNKLFLTPRLEELFALRLAIGRPAVPEDVAKTVVALASGAMPYMTGEVMRVDGGWSTCNMDYGELQELL